MTQLTEREQVQAHLVRSYQPAAVSADEFLQRERIKALLKAHNATLVAHYYTEDSLQALAEETGGCVADSLEMARFGAASPSSTLVVAGVRFMGETAKMLSPDKRVLMPTLGLATLDELPPMHTLSAPPDTDNNQDYNASPEGDILALHEEDAPAVSPDNASETVQHAEKASTQSTLDFATLGQRLIERRHSLSDQTADNRHDDESNDTDDNDD